MQVLLEPDKYAEIIIDASKDEKLTIHEFADNGFIFLNITGERSLTRIKLTKEQAIQIRDYFVKGEYLTIEEKFETERLYQECKKDREENGLFPEYTGAGR